MTPLVDPLLNRFVAYPKVDLARTFSNSLDRLTPPLDFLRREFSGRLHQFRHWLAVTRDRDLAALLAPAPRTQGGKRRAPRSTHSGLDGSVLSPKMWSQVLNVARNATVRR